MPETWTWSLSKKFRHFQCRTTTRRYSIPSMCCTTHQCDRVRSKHDIAKLNQTQCLLGQWEREREREIERVRERPRDKKKEKDCVMVCVSNVCFVLPPSMSHSAAHSQHSVKSEPFRLFSILVCGSSSFRRHGNSIEQINRTKKKEKKNICILCRWLDLIFFFIGIFVDHSQ